MVSKANRKVLKMQIMQKADAAVEIAKEAGSLALRYFLDRESLVVDAKGHQDFVTMADKQVELLIRKRFAQQFPDDGIVGEEHEPTPGVSGFTWVIDPIDGTANFIDGRPFWCVAIAGVFKGQTVIGVIFDPVHDEAFVAIDGQGASLNGKELKLKLSNIETGTVCIGSSRRAKPEDVAALVTGILKAGGVFARSGSGALGLAYVAAGRYLGYSESYMNAWDCLAAQLMIIEAGGQTNPKDPMDVIANGTGVISGAPGIFDRLQVITYSAFSEKPFI